MAGRYRLLMVGLPLAATVALASAVVSIARSNAPEDSVPARSAPPSALAEPSAMPSLPSVIGGLGLVEPAGREVAVAAPVPGVISAVRVAPGDTVPAGDVLFTIEDAIPAATVEQRRRDLAVAEARLNQMLARLPILEADVAAARTAAVAAEADLDEAKDLVRIADELRVGSAITARERTRRRNDLHAAEARVAEARSRVQKAEAELALIDPDRDGASFRIEEASVAQARAALALAEADLDRHTVRAPAAGTILAVNIRPGEYAVAGAAEAPVVMGRLHPLHVRVDIDEADLPRFQAEGPAVALPRGAPERRIPLRLVRPEPQVTPKRTLSGSSTDRVDTRVLQIIYAVAEAESGLKPGQLVDVFIGVPEG